jgi:Ca2+-binding EF-hand superfamily protein
MLRTLSLLVVAGCVAAEQPSWMRSPPPLPPSPVSLTPPTMPSLGAPPSAGLPLGPPDGNPPPVPQLPSLDGVDEVSDPRVDADSLEDIGGSLASTIAAAPAKDIAALDSTVKLLGETLFTAATETVGKQEKEDVPVGGAQVDRVNLRGSVPKALAIKVEDAEKDLAHEEARTTSKNIQSEVTFSLGEKKMKNLDTNNDGFLEKPELTAAMKNILPLLKRVESLRYKNFERKDLNTIFRVTDRNKDGYLSPDEIFGLQREEKHKFAFADKNHDNQLDPDEFFLFENPKFLPSAQANELSAREMMDYRGGTGRVPALTSTAKLTWDEYHQNVLHQMAGRSKQAQTAAVKRQHKKFDQVDANHDGALSLHEAEKFVAANEGTSEINTVVGKLMSVADSNDDGKLSLSEIIQHSHQLGGNVMEFFQDHKVLVNTLGYCSTSTGQAMRVCQQGKVVHHHS